MKFFLIISVLIAALFSGCAGKPKPHKPISVETNIYDNGDLVIGGFYPQKDYTCAETQEKTSTIQKLAVLTKKAAEIFKENGFEYFTIDSEKRYPKILTNIQDINNYCYPSNKGFHMGDTKSTSLEDKCSIEFTITVMNSIVPVGVSISFRGIKNPSIDTPSWSVDSVLKDKNIEGLYNAILEDNKIKNDLIFKISTTKKK